MNRPSDEHKMYMRGYRELRKERSTSMHSRREGSIKRYMPPTITRLYREIGIVLPQRRRYKNVTGTKPPDEV
jgi:hypothetical protein